MTILSSQLDAFGQLVRFEAWDEGQEWSELSADLAPLVATSVRLLERIERAIARKHPPSGWDEAVVRAFLPLLGEWVKSADHLREGCRQCRLHGYPVEGIMHLLGALARTRPFAENFDEMMRISDEIDRGDTAHYRTLQEIMNELPAPSESEAGSSPQQSP
jgi:hypothetical protein